MYDNINRDQPIEDVRILNANLGEYLSCKEIEMLYYIVDNSSLEYAMDLMKIKYNFSESELTSFVAKLREKLSKVYKIDGIERFANMMKEKIEKSYGKCLIGVREELINELDNLSKQEIFFLNYVIKHNNLHSINDPILNYLTGTFKACTGLEISKETLIKMIKIGITPKYKKIGENIYQWVEVNETLWMLIKNHLDERKIKISEKPIVTLKRDTIILLDVLTKLTMGKYFSTPKKIVNEILSSNFPHLKPPNQLTPLFTSDENYYYVCPEKTQVIRDNLLKYKGDIIKQTMYNSMFNRNFFEKTSLGDLIAKKDYYLLIVTPWFYFHKPSIFTSKMPEYYLLTNEELIKIIVIVDQKLTPSVIKTLLSSRIKDIFIIQKSTMEGWELTRINNQLPASEVMEKIQHILGIKFKDNTCGNLKLIFPLTESSIRSFIKNNYNSEEITVLLETLGINSKHENEDHAITEGIKRFGLDYVAKIFGYPPFIYC